MIGLVQQMQVTGNGFLDRFFLIHPRCLRPDPEEQISAGVRISNHAIKIKEIYEAIQDKTLTLKLSDTACKRFLSFEKEQKEQHNQSHVNAVPVNPSKVFEFVGKVSIALHLLETAFTALSANERPEDIAFDPEVPLETLKRAILYTKHIEEQKAICISFIDKIIGASRQPKVVPPSNEEYKEVLMKLPVAVITKRILQNKGTRRCKVAQRCTIC